MTDIQTYEGDCREVWSTWPDDIAHVVVTSPPYNMNLRISTGKGGEIRHHSRQIVKENSTKYSNYDDNLTLPDYFEFSVEVVTNLLRLAPLVFYNVQFLTGNKSALFKLIGHFSDNLKEIIVWDKVNAQPAVSEQVLNSQFEVILVFERDGAASRRFKNAMFDRGTLSNHWDIKRGKKIHKDHGAVFPAGLVEKIVENFTRVDDTVFGPFMGTGTTGVVCKQMGRKFIGIEMDSDYLEFAKSRIGDT